MAAGRGASALPSASSSGATAVSPPFDQGHSPILRRESATALPRLPAAEPTPREQRVTSVDVVRGFALLGILLMNIVGFGLYRWAYAYPTAAGGADGANLWIWIILHIAAEGKMRCLFSLVFGASIVLLASRLEGRSDAADIYYRRILWLLAFGIVHAYLLWQGDILYPYALCALALYPFRNLRPRTLLIIGATSLVVLSGWNVMHGFFRVNDRDAGEAAIAMAARGETLTEEQKEAKEDWAKFLKSRRPTEGALRKDAAHWQGGFISVVKARGKLVNEYNARPYYEPGALDMWGMMFLGMALLKMGVLGAKKSVRFYLGLMGAGYAVGGAINSYTAYLVVKSGFDPVVYGFIFVGYDLGRFSVALGHMCLLLLLCRQGWLTWLTSRLGAVGQMALTNYIMTSVICAFVFTGYGLRLYGQLERHQLYYVVAAISVVQLAISPIWLKYYRYGPLEWCWRSLTYWQRLPMRLGAPEDRAIPPCFIARTLPTPEQTLPTA